MKNFLVENEQVKIHLQHQQYVLIMQQIEVHIISFIKQIINSKEISQMENLVLVHYQIFILNHLIIMHDFGMMMIIIMIMHMIGVLHHIQQKKMIMKHQRIYHYQKQLVQQ